MHSATKGKKAVLLISFELDEIINVSDRIAVIYEGQIVGEVLPEETNDRELGLMMVVTAPKREVLRMNNVLKWFTRDLFILPVVAIIMGLILGGVVMLIGGYNPIEAYGALFTKVFGDMYNFGEAVREMTPLIMTGLSICICITCRVV